MIPLLFKPYEASAAIAPFRIVAFSDAANGSKVAQATLATQTLIGTTGKVPTAAGEMADIIRVGIGGVQLGGTVIAGDRLTSDANGCAVKATIAGQHIIGTAEAPGVAGDIIDYLRAGGVHSGN
jgi:hypothetical protein